MTSWLSILMVCLQGSLFISGTGGEVQCDCSTEECRQDERKMCTAKHYCFVEYNSMTNSVSQGCIDGRTPLLCENRRPETLDTPWPVLYCCNDKDYCNRDIMPSIPPQSKKEDVQKHEEEITTEKSKCDDAQTVALFNKEEGDAKIINPIYIAVPVAGVCVLLALIIFAIYLLRKRNYSYEHYNYPDSCPALQGSKHNCDNNTMCNGKVNRCTDSERSSSGSESKLFLQV